MRSLWYHSNTPFSAPPINETRPLGFLLLVYRVKSLGCVSSSSSQKRINGASRLERRSGRDDAVLLLHELLAGSLDGDGKTELGGVLGRLSVCGQWSQCIVTAAYLGVVHLTGKGHADRRSDNLLEEAADLTLRVDLCAEDGS